MKTMRATLQSLADAAGQYLYDYAEADEVRRIELRKNLGNAEDAAREVLLADDLHAPTTLAAPPERRRRVQIVVDYFDHSTRYYPVPFGEGWKIDTAQRMIVIGRCVNRQMVPLDNVASFSPEEYFEEVF